MVVVERRRSSCSRTKDMKTKKRELWRMRLLVSKQERRGDEDEEENEGQENKNQNSALVARVRFYFYFLSQLQITCLSPSSSLLLLHFLIP